MSDDQKKSMEPSGPIKKVQVGGWRRIFGKKWVFPAMYMGIAAIILAFVMWYQDSKDFSILNKAKENANPQEQAQQNGGEIAVTPQGNPQAEKATPVNGSDKPLAWPSKKDAGTEKVMSFFDDGADKKAQEASLVQYDNSYWPNSGMAIAAKNKKTFDVTAAAAGKVTKAERDPMLGYQVEVEHANGLVTVYASLEDAKVKVGDEVEQGTVVGTAGRNVFEKDLGVHLHFEVHKDGLAVQPEQYLQKSTSEASAK
jgi:stage II sporulation protein Q